MSISTLQAKVAKVTADCPFNGANLDVSTWATDADYVISIRIRGLTSTDAIVPWVVIQVDGNAAHDVVWVKTHYGQVLTTQEGVEVKYSIPSRELKSVLTGHAGDLIRLSVLAMSANSTFTYEAFVLR